MRKFPRTMRAPLLTFCLLASACLPALSVVAQDRPIDAAAAAYEEGELFRALELYEEVLSTPGNSPTDLLAIHLRLGVLRGSVGNDDGARAAFRMALALDPSLEAPSELNPDLRDVFDEIKAAQGGVGLALDAAFPREVDPTRETEVRLTATGAPEGLAVGFRVATSHGDGSAPAVFEGPASAEGRLTITIPPSAWRGGTSLDLEASVLDAHGSVLLSRVGPLVATVLPPPSTETAETGEEPDDEAGGSVFASPWFWIITGVVLLGGAAAITAVALTSGTSNPDVGPPMIMGLSL